MHTLNLADLLPLTAIWSGPETHPCPMYPPNSPPLLYAATTGSTPFRLSLHVSDLGHFGIFGPPGGGKSTLLDLLIAQHFRYAGAQVFGFDLGYSMATLCVAAGGAHYDIGAEGSKIGFCPLAQIDTLADRTWAAEYIELLVTLRLPDGQSSLSVAQQNEISRAIHTMAEDTKDLPEKERTKNRTLTHFCSTVQDNEVKTALVYYTVDQRHGVLGHLLDAEEDSLSTSKFIVFETSHLIGMGDNAVVPVFMYLFRQIEKRVARSIPTMIPIDEGFRSFGHPLALARFDSWLETMRKENVAVGFATQNLDKVIKSPVGSTIIQTTATKFMLPNPEAATQNVAPIYRAFGLNDRQIQNLAYARQKRDYYVMNSDGRRMFELGLGKVALAFVGASGKDQMAHVRTLKNQYGDEWVYHYLNERGVPQDWGNYWQRLNKEMRA
jgi:type IV secretion system protein VirB4